MPNTFHSSRIAPRLKIIKLKMMIKMMMKMTMMSNLSLLWRLKCSHLVHKTMDRLIITPILLFSRQLCSRMMQTLLMHNLQLQLLWIITLMTQRLYK